MQASHRCPAPPCTRVRRPAADAGYSLVEAIVALSVIGVVLAALSVFYVRSVALTHQQGSRQVAVQLVLDGIDQVRAMQGSAVRDATLPPDEPRVVNGVSYDHTFHAEPCWQPAGRPPADLACAAGPADGMPDSAYAELQLVVITVTWPDKDCTDYRCSYTNSTLISSSIDDPVFPLNGGT